jgi:ubiquinone/menaquinone biosynthesis C-methylase UbiE
VTVQKDPERHETKYLHRYADFAGKRVLEVGCGDGRLTWRYAKAARRVTAIDLDRDGLRLALIERASDLEGVVAFAQTDSSRLPFASATFDMSVLAWSF